MRALGRCHQCPSPILDRPTRAELREEDDGRAVLEVLHVSFEPFELFMTQAAESAGFEVHDVHQADEMCAAVIEAVPSVAS